MTPDFILIGGMKCGTTTLATQLAAQPGIFMTKPKEPNFFSDDAIYAQGEDWYRALFSDADPDVLRGEASTHYTKLPDLPHTLPRMQAMLTRPKFIYMIRNPVNRVVSHYIHDWTEKRISGDIVQAIGTRPALVNYSLYAMQISPFIKAYGVQSIHLTSLEQLTAAPQETLEEIGAFLGMATRPCWQENLSTQNVSAERFRPFPMRRLLMANPVARTLRRLLVPKSLREKVRRARSITTRPELPQDIRRSLEQVFAEDHVELSRLFPGHPALRLCYPFL